MLDQKTNVRMGRIYLSTVIRSKIVVITARVFPS